jgi:hypothetical protein
MGDRRFGVRRRALRVFKRRRTNQLDTKIGASRWLDFYLDFDFGAYPIGGALFARQCCWSLVARCCHHVSRTGGLADCIAFPS